LSVHVRLVAIPRFRRPGTSPAALREAAAVLTYIRNAWGNAAPPVSADEVEKHRDSLAKDGG